MKRFFSLLARLEKGIVNKRTGVIIKLRWELKKDKFKARIYLLKGDEEECYSKFKFKFVKLDDEAMSTICAYLVNELKEAYMEEED